MYVYMYVNTLLWKVLSKISYIIFIFLTIK